MYMGHEPAGIIVDSNGSEKFKEGDRVAVEPGMPCVTSYWSMKGKHNLCDKGTFMGANAQGAFSDYVIVEELQLVKRSDIITNLKLKTQFPEVATVTKNKAVDCNGGRLAFS